MAKEVPVLVGSGVTQGLSEVPVNAIKNERFIQASAVAVLNPEDASAGGTLLHSQITVAATGVSIPTVRLDYRRSVAIHNLSGNTIYLGSDDTVDETDGFPLAVGATITLEIKANVEVFARTESGTADIRILQASQVI